MSRPTWEHLAMWPNNSMDVYHKFDHTHISKKRQKFCLSEKQIWDLRRLPWKIFLWQISKIPCLWRHRMSEPTYECLVTWPDVLVDMYHMFYHTQVSKKRQKINVSEKKIGTRGGFLGNFFLWQIAKFSCLWRHRMGEPTYERLVRIPKILTLCTIKSTIPTIQGWKKFVSLKNIETFNKTRVAQLRYILTWHPFTWHPSPGTPSPGTPHLAPLTWHPSPGTPHLAPLTWWYPLPGGTLHLVVPLAWHLSP